MALQQFLSELMQRNGADSVTIVSDDASPLPSSIRRRISRIEFPPSSQATLDLSSVSSPSSTSTHIKASVASSAIDEVPPPPTADTRFGSPSQERDLRPPRAPVRTPSQSDLSTPPSAG